MALQLKQESFVEIGDRRVTVTSEVFLEPEALIVTQVCGPHGILRKTHIALPPAAVHDGQKLGLEALRPSLQTHHLRYLRNLLSEDGDAPVDSSAPARAGLLATIVLGAAGEVLARAGEDQVPGGWLRSTYLVIGLADIFGRTLSLGPLRHAFVRGEGIAAHVVCEDGKTRFSFVAPAVISPDFLGGLKGKLEELACLNC
jgi:hypothetical protein